jgi:hypothetical protein
VQKEYSATECKPFGLARHNRGPITHTGVARITHQILFAKLLKRNRLLGRTEHRCEADKTKIKK